MANNGKDTKHTINIATLCKKWRRVQFAQDSVVWGRSVVGDTGTKNFREDELNPRLVYAMKRLENRHNTCTRGMIGYRRVQRKCVLNDSNVLS